MASEPLDISQLDLSDPETRTYVQGQIDLSDPDTKKWWDSTAPASDVPLMGQENLPPSVEVPEQSVFDRRLQEAQGVRPGLDPENEFGGPRFFENGLPNPLSTVRDIADLAARGFEYAGAAGNTGLEYLDKGAEASGLADLLSVDGNKFLPGSAIGAFGEAFPMGGIETGFVPKVNIRTPQGEPAPFVQQLFDERGADTTPDIDPVARQAQLAEYQRTIQEMVNSGKTASQIRHYVASTGADPSLIRGLDEGVPQGRVSLIDEPDAGPISNADRMPGYTPVDEALEAEANAFRSRQEPTPEDLWPSEETLRAREAELEGRLAAEAEEFQGRKTEEPEANKLEADEDLPENVQSIVNHVNELTADWENSPDTAVYDNFDGFDGVDPNSLGVYNPEDGLVYLNAKAIDREAEHRGLTQQEMTNTVMFHEGLGHYGLAQKFREDLDNTLANWYERSAWFKNKTDKWHDENPDTYADDPNPLIRASEEVLAELSETGKMPVKLLDIFKNQIKDYARRMGVNWDPITGVSAREIRTILAQAHEAVLSGKGADVRGNGYRSMKSSYGESEGSVQGRAGREEMEGDPSVIHKVRSNRQIDDILDNADVEKTKETWGEWQSDADRIKMTTRMAEQLAAGTTPAELLAAEKHAAKLANTISDLSHKAANQTLSPKEAALLAQHTKALDKTAQAISDVVANAARLLGSRKIEIATDETVAARLVRNMSASQIADLATPEGARKFAIQVTRSQKKAKLIEGAVQAWGNIMGFTRAIWSSYDLSAPFRQARALAHTGDFWKNMPNMLKYWGNKGFYDMTMDSIKQRPSYKQMQKSGLAFTELSSDLSKREEAFMSTWAEKIPGVRQSERAYNGYLNKLRADLFDTMYQKLDDAGVDFEKDPKALRDLAHFINNASGRGNLDLGKFAPTAAGVLFSPRLMASRMQMLNPMYYAKLSPGVRAQAIKSAMAFATTSVIFAKLAQSAGLDVEWDPRSSDFMKLKKGDTRYDMLGGFGQYVTLYSRLAPEFMGGNRKKNAKGDITILGEKFGSDDALDVVKEFVRNKFSPNMALLVDYKLGENTIGEKFDAKTEAARRFIPLILQDFYKQIKAEGAVGAAKAVPGIVGVGVQTYPGPKGFDIYGRSYETDRTVDDPTISEVKRLQEDREETVLGPPGRSLTVDGERRKLTDEEFNAYQELSAKWIMEDLAADMNTVEWQDASDEEKIEWIREVSREARKDAREELFATEEQEPEETTTPWGEFE